MEQLKRFKKNELGFADEKLRMLFRLTLLYDIGIEVTNTSLDTVIKRINKWYKCNELA